MCKQAVLHITNGNCSPPIRAVRVPQNRSRACALCAVLFHHIFARRKPSVCFIRRAKTSVT